MPKAVVPLVQKRIITRTLSHAPFLSFLSFSATVDSIHISQLQSISIHLLLSMHTILICPSIHHYASTKVFAINSTLGARSCEKGCFIVCC